MRKGSRGQSLRARLLFLQLVVTTLFLLVLGVVSTKLYADSLTKQFHSVVRDDSARSAIDIIQHPKASMSAVLVTLSPFHVETLANTGRPGQNRAVATLPRGRGRAKDYRMALNGTLFVVPPFWGTQYRL